MREPKRKKTSNTFNLLAQDEESYWWKNFFEQLGNGMFPYRLSYINGSLSYPKNGKFIQILIENRDLEELREDIKRYIRKDVGIIPDDDIEEYSTINSYTEITWATLVKDNLLRNILISKYIATLKLSKNEQAKMRGEIWWGFLRGDFTAANFIIENRQITNYYPILNKKENKYKKDNKFIITKINPLKIVKKTDMRPTSKLQILQQLNKNSNKDSVSDD